MDYKDSVSLQKAFSDATNLLSNLRTRLAHSTPGLSSQTDVDKIQPFQILNSFTNKRRITSCRREAATICPRRCTLRAQLQPIHALRLACGVQRALLPVAMGAMNIHDVRDRRRQTSDRQTSDKSIA